MEPIAILMIEHRLTERMLKLMDGEAERIRATGKADLAFVGATIDFVNSYIDESHHGKEEDILFKDLSQKPITAELKNTMDVLVREHDCARALLEGLNGYYTKYVEGDGASLTGIEESLAGFVALYSRHIEKEDRHFFFPAMEYFDSREKSGMIERSRRYDAGLIHDKYRKMVAGIEQEKSPTPVRG